MKKYFIAVAALAFLAACNGKAAKDTPVLVEEESIAVAEAAPDAPSLPELPVVKAKPAKPVNMRDSLKLDPFYQQDSDDGVYELDATYLEAENGKDQTFTSTGKRQVKKGTPADASAVIYELIPSDGSMVFYFQAEGDSLTMLNQELQKAASDLNYTLKLVQ